MTNNIHTGLSAPVSVLRGVGARVAERLQGLGIETVQDLLFHLPSRYEDRTRIAPLGSLRAGDRVAIEGEIELTEVVYRRRRMMMSRIADGTGSITLRFFHFSQQQQKGLSRGTRLRCYGDPRLRRVQSLRQSGIFGHGCDRSLEYRHVIQGNFQENRAVGRSVTEFLLQPLVQIDLVDSKALHQLDIG